MLRFSIVLLLVAAQFYSGQARTQCKGLGQYCKSHSDCCSTSCSSYAYKCVERHDSYFNMELSTFSSFNELVDRCGGNDDATTTNTYIAHPNEMPSTSFPVETNQPATSTIRTDHNESECRVNGFSCLNSDQCCSSFCSKITNMCIHPQPDSLSAEQMSLAREPVVTSTNPPPCYPIGHKCYSPIECCAPLRCLGYLHQCVT